MSDTTNVKFNNGTPEQVALDLTNLVIRQENYNQVSVYVDEKSILDLYAKCLQATLNNR